MNVRIDAKQLFPFIKAFYELSGIKIAIYDDCMNEILSYPENRSAFCTMLEVREDLKTKCDACDGRYRRECVESGKTIIYKCHAGLTEMIAPLTDRGTTIGYVICGQITNRGDREAFVQDVLERCRGYGLEESEMLQKLTAIRYYSNDQLDATVQIINALASYIVLQKWIYVAGKPLEQQIVDYIENNLEKELSLDDLSRRFAMSKSELYLCTAERMPEGIARYIRARRLAKAKSDIEKFPEKPLWKIAEDAGFPNYEYFLRVFKKETGESAAAVRRGQKKKREK